VESLRKAVTVKAKGVIALTLERDSEARKARGYWRIRQSTARASFRAAGTVAGQNGGKAMDFDHDKSAEAANAVWAKDQKSKATANRRGRIALRCNECGRRFSIGSRSSDPQCPKCHGVDYEVL
jgi:hypothetical protein